MRAMPALMPSATTLSMTALSAAMLFATPLAAAAQEAPASAPATAPVSDACKVWERERGVALAGADHDGAAFAGYLHPDAVFISGGATRGAEAIATEWAGIIEGKQVVLRWYPDAVDVGANGQVALSRGPYYMENPAAPPEKRYRLGRFISTWVRDADGEWRVVFDGGAGDAPKPATADEVANMIANRKPCPAS